MPRTGRPTKIPQKKVKELFDLMSKGFTKYSAAAKAGIAERTIDFWRERAKQDLNEGLESSVYIDFLREYDRHRGLGAFEGESLVREYLLSGDPQLMRAGVAAGVQRLKLSHPDKFRDQLEVSGGDKPLKVKVDLTKYSDEELEQYQALLEKGVEQ